MKLTVDAFNAAVIEQYPWLLSESVTRGDFCRGVARGPGDESSGSLPLLTERISFAQVDDALLDTTPSEEIGTDLSGWETWDIIQVRGQDGSVLAVVPPDRYSYAEPRNRDKGETVADTLASLPPQDLSRVAFITRASGNTSSFNGTEPAGSLTVFRVSKLRIDLWLDARKDKANAAVLASVGHVDLMFRKVQPVGLEVFGAHGQGWLPATMAAIEEAYDDATTEVAP